ncbi:hypothetical protein NEF87_000860 [Candidatus Lokiarchaeum ossiferum]|uniref:histidine kinase n=1 Tax=Candidatus Lokiarchaeum ossiferum TaxID=2951803 RepID=A0ABY6HM35_9ARCH|nr:hypothetical protein NEF87_000860 [Candidatus Lokiarchaeum sp. B-35]
MTDPKKSHTSITNSEDIKSKFYRYQRLVELSGDIIIEVNLKCQLIYANPSLYHVLGYALSNFDTLFLDDIIHVDDIDIFNNSYNEFQNGKLTEFTCKFRGKHILGHSLWLQGSFSKNINQNEQLVSILGIIRNIDKQKTIQNKLVKSEKQFREVLDNSHDISYRLNLKTGLYDYLSPVIEIVTGYSLKEASRDFISTKINKEDMLRNQEKLKRKLSQTKHGTVSMQNVARFQCSNGKIKWFSDKFTYYQDRHGNPLYSVGSIRDITSSIEQLDALRLSEDRFKEVLEGSRTISYHLNLKTEEYEYVGPIMEEITGYKQEQITYPFVLAHIHPDDAKKNMAELNFHLTNSTALKINLVQDARFLCKNGEYKWFRDALTFIRDGNGNPMASIGSIQDITESKLLDIAYRKSEERYRIIIENFPFPLAISDNQDHNLYVNPKFTETFGYTLDEISTTEDWAHLAYPDETYRNSIFAQLNEVTHQLSEPRINNVQCKNGDVKSVILRDISISESEFITIFEDISDKKKIEKKIQHVQQRYQKIVEHFPFPIVVTGSENELKYINPKFTEMFGYTLEDIPNSEKWMECAYPNENYRKSLPLRANYLDEGLSEIRERIVTCKDNSEKIVQFRDLKIGDGEEVTFCIDITFQQKARLMLEKSEQKFREVLEHSTDAAYKFNCISGKYDYMSPVIKKIFGYSHQEIESMSSDEINQLIHPEDLKNFRFPEVSLETNPNLQISHNIEYRSLSKQGSYFWIGDNHTIFRNDAGESQYIIGSLRNITEIKNREKKLKQIVNEKNILLKEVHHRVKNNLQIITSMLNLQSGYYKDPNFARIVKNSKNRIESILVVYESLYLSENFESINFIRFIQTLLRNLLRSYHVDPAQIQNDVEADNIWLTLDQSVPITLIINEIVSNSLKYAFPEKSQGKISIQFKNHRDKNILTVADNGIGISQSVDLANPNTFGLQLISILTDQIKGRLSLDLNHGTKYIIEIPNEK